MANKYKNLLITTAISLAAVTSVVAVSANSNNNGSFSGVIGDQKLHRTVTANENNRITTAYFKNNETDKAGFPLDAQVLFKLEGNNYALIETSQEQKNLEPNNNDCVLALWTNAGGYFTINYDSYSNKPIYRNNSYTRKLDVYKIDHITQIDIVLDNKKIETNRATSKFTSSVGTVTDEGVVDEENECVTYTWTGDVTDGGELTFYASESGTGKVYWVRSLTFHYEC